MQHQELYETGVCFRQARHCTSVLADPRAVLLLRWGRLSVHNATKSRFEFPSFVTAVVTAG